MYIYINLTSTTTYIQSSHDQLSFNILRWRSLQHLVALVQISAHCWRSPWVSNVWHPCSVWVATAWREKQVQCQTSDMAGSSMKANLVHGQWMVFCKWHMMPLPKLYPMSFLIIELSILILICYQFQDVCYQNHNSRCFHFQGSYHVIPHNKYLSMSGSFGGDVHLTERRILTMICRVIGRRWHQMLKTKRNSGNG